MGPARSRFDCSRRAVSSTIVARCAASPAAAPALPPPGVQLVADFSCCRRADRRGSVELAHATHPLPRFEYARRCASAASCSQLCSPSGPLPSNRYVDHTRTSASLASSPPRRDTRARTLAASDAAESDLPGFSVLDDGRVLAPRHSSLRRAHTRMGLATERPSALELA